MAFQRAVEHARKYSEEIAETWEKIGVAKASIPTPQLEINKEAIEAFKKEVISLKKIESIWEGILKDEQEGAKETREQAAREYHRGNHSDWNALTEQERARYNNEAKKANEEYNQKRIEKQEEIIKIQAKKLKIEHEIKRIKDQPITNTFYSLFSTQQKEKLNQFQQQLVELNSGTREIVSQLADQEKLLMIGRKARQKENYHQALTQIKNSEEKAKEGKSAYWNKVSECYLKASRYWEQSTNDNSREIEQQENEKIATSYQHAAEAYQKAAEEQIAFITIQSK